jgi:hypothetical protein
MSTIDRQAIIETLSRLVTPGIKLTALADELGAHKHEYAELRSLILDLVEDGTVHVLPGGAFALAPSGRPGDPAAKPIPAVKPEPARSPKKPVPRSAAKLVPKLAVKPARPKPSKAAKADADRAESARSAAGKPAKASARKGAARKATAALKRKTALPPLHGIPVSIKDLTPTKGIRTTWGSKIFEHHVPEEDAVVVARLKAAGAIVIGKTNTPEFGLGSHTFNKLHGATRNAYDQHLSAGGAFLVWKLPASFPLESTHGEPGPGPLSMLKSEALTVTFRR